MNLIFIYGPPAAGKHTIGAELARLTGYAFFYNHITVNVVRVLFPDDTHSPERSVLLDKLRLDVIDTAARLDADIIFTLAYTKGVSDPFVADIITTVTGHGGTVHFVQLHPPEATLFERINNASRHALAKPTDPKKLRQVLDAHDMHAHIDYNSSVTIDTSKVNPTEAAQRIIEKFSLVKSS